MTEAGASEDPNCGSQNLVHKQVRTWPERVYLAGSPFVHSWHNEAGRSGDCSGASRPVFKGWPKRVSCRDVVVRSHRGKFDRGETFSLWSLTTVRPRRPMAASSWDFADFGTLWPENSSPCIPIAFRILRREAPSAREPAASGLHRSQDSLPRGSVAAGLRREAPRSICPQIDPASPSSK